MTAASPAPERRRSRPGSLERPINGRLYRGTWLLVGLPLLLLAFSVARPPALQLPNLPPAFKAATAAAIAQGPRRHLSGPATRNARGPRRSGLVPPAAGARIGFHVQSQPFTATIDGRRTTLVQPRDSEGGASGLSPPEIVVMAHRDDSGPGADSTTTRRAPRR